MACVKLLSIPLFSLLLDCNNKYDFHSHLYSRCFSNQSLSSFFSFLLFFLQVGYGNAAGCVLFLTSYFGVIGFRRCCSDTSLILIGMLSFAFGIYFMSFVTTTLTFYLGKNKCL